LVKSVFRWWRLFGLFQKLPSSFTVELHRHMGSTTACPSRGNAQCPPTVL
jgi:hypothetical protein